jgi:tetratricopeptide (TPR) repeat protein
MMSGARARAAAYWLAGLILMRLALAEVARSAEVSWREALQRAEAALAGGDARGAEEAWQEAYRAAMRRRAPDALLDLGRAYLLIGEAARNCQTAVARARRIFREALFQARERRDTDGVARAGEAFASIGDHHVALRAFDAALALAERNRDAIARDRIAVLRARSDYAIRTP